MFVCLFACVCLFVCSCVYWLVDSFVCLFDFWLGVCSFIYYLLFMYLAGGVFVRLFISCLFIQRVDCLSVCLFVIVFVFCVCLFST